MAAIGLIRLVDVPPMHRTFFLTVWLRGRKFATGAANNVFVCLEV